METFKATHFCPECDTEYSFPDAKGPVFCDWFDCEYEGPLERIEDGDE